MTTDGERLTERHVETNDAYKKLRRGIRAQRIGLSLLVAWMVIVPAISAYGVWLIRSQQVRSVSTNQNTALTVQTVKKLLFRFNDCINPKGSCAQRNAAKTAHVLRDLKSTMQRVVIYQGVCNHTPGVDQTSPASVAQCVAHLLNEQGD